MALTLVDFEIPDWNTPISIICGGSVPGGFGGFSAQDVHFLINEGGMALSGVPLSDGGSGRRLDFRKMCPFHPDPEGFVADNAILVIRFDTPHRYIKFELNISTIPSPTAPVVVSYYQLPSQGGNLVKTESITDAFKTVTYDMPCYPIREIIIFSPRDQNSLDNLEFGEKPSPGSILRGINFILCYLKAFTYRVLQIVTPSEPLILKWPPEENPPEKNPPE